jgi:hypothetical protein
MLGPRQTTRSGQTPSPAGRVGVEDEGGLREIVYPNRFGAPATFRKWPSHNRQRRIDSSGPYLLAGSTLGECIQQFMAKPTATRHLNEIHTLPQAPFLGEVVTAADVAELEQLRDFLARAAKT